VIRKAFLMHVHPDAHAEYERRHSPIWPELEATLRAHGAHNYSIFLHAPSSQLFAYVEIDSEERWNAIAQTDVCRRWWAMMCDIMPSHPDNSPQSDELPCVFHLD
jgi:L-rhamnose mutarotase